MTGDDIKYAQYTGALTTMTRFLIMDLTEAVSMLGNEDHWRVKNFHITIDHAKQVLKDVEEKREFSQQDRILSDGRTKTATGFVEEPTCTDLSEFQPDLGS